MDLKERHSKVTANEHGRQSRHETSVKIRKQNKDDSVKKKRFDDAHLENMEAIPLTPRELDIHIMSFLTGFVNLLTSEEPGEVMFGVTSIRKLLTQGKQKDPTKTKIPIAEVIASGAVPILIQLMKQSKEEEMIYELAWSISNLLSGEVDQTYYVNSFGALEVFSNMYLNPELNPKIRDQIIWAIGNLAGDATFYRNIVIQNGVFQKLLVDIRNEEDVLNHIGNTEVYTFFLHNFCMGSPALTQFQYGELLITLSKVMEYHYRNHEIMRNVCYCIMDASKEVPGAYTLLRQTTIPMKMVEFAQCGGTEHLKQPAPYVYIFGMIAVGDAEYVINIGAVPVIIHVLLNSMTKPHVQERCCWALGLIASVNEHNTRVVLGDTWLSKLLVRIGYLMQVGDIDMRSAALSLVYDMVQSPDIIQMFRTYQIIKVVIDIVMGNTLDHSFRVMAMNTLNVMIRLDPGTVIQDFYNAGGRERLDDLELHPNKTIVEASQKLLSTIRYERGEEEEEEEEMDY